MIDDEIWLPIPGYEGYYSVSSLGRVRSEDRAIPSSRWGIQNRRGAIMAPRIVPTGYRTVGLRKNGGRRWFVSISRLVCMTFHGEPPTPEHEAAHYPDPSRANNRADNLRWATPKENQGHRREHGTAPAGEGNGSAKITAEQAREIRAKHVRGRPCHPGNQAQLALEYGLCQGAILAIARGKTWREI